MLMIIIMRDMYVSEVLGWDLRCLEALAPPSLSSSLASSQRSHGNLYVSFVKVFIMGHLRRHKEDCYSDIKCMWSIKCSISHALTRLKCQPAKGFLFSCQILSLVSFPRSGSSIWQNRWQINHIQHRSDALNRWNA